MKPIDVVRELVKDNPNDMQLGEVVRQYIHELPDTAFSPQNWIEGMSRTKHFAEGFHEGKWEEDTEWPGLDNIIGEDNVG